jgi:hypothetical protein
MIDTDMSAAAHAVISAAADLPALENRLEALEARVKQVESYLGHIHPVVLDTSFKEYPKAVGAEVAYSVAEEAELLRSQKKTAA